MCLIRNGSQSSLSVSASISSPGKLTHTYEDHQHTNNSNHRHTNNHSDVGPSSPDSLNGGHRTLSLVLSEDICSGRETEPWQWVWKMNRAHELCRDESDDLITTDSNESNSKDHRYIRSKGLGHYWDAHVRSLTHRHTRRPITNTAHNENYTNKHMHAHTHASKLWLQSTCISSCLKMNVSSKNKKGFTAWPVTWLKSYFQVSICWLFLKKKLIMCNDALFTISKILDKQAYSSNNFLISSSS